MRMRVRRKEPQLAVATADGGTADAAAGPAAGRRMSLTFQRTLEGYFFVAPWVVGFVIFMAWPLFQSFFLSFHELQATSLSDLKFRGIDNYKEAFFIDARFLPRLKETLTQNLLDVPVIMIFSLFSAILANQKIKGVIGFRAVFFLPLVIGSAQVIQQLFSQGVGGRRPLPRGEHPGAGLPVPGPGRRLGRRGAAQPAPLRALEDRACRCSSSWPASTASPRCSTKPRAWTGPRTGTASGR